MSGFLNWKLLRHNLAPFYESYIELAAFLAILLLVGLSMTIRGRRQLWRHVVQAMSMFVFFFLVSTCVGVFGLVWNAWFGLELPGKDDLRAFYLMGLTVAVLGMSFTFGPVFCGWVCPTGTLQELVGSLRLGWKRQRWVRRPALVVGVIAAGLIVYLLVCRAVFETRTSQAEDSAVLWASALAAVVAVAALNRRHDRPLKRLRWVSLALLLGLCVAGVAVSAPVHFVFCNVRDWSSLLSTAMIMGVSVAVMRAWCRYLCPFGLLCCLAGKHALRRIVVSSACTGCNRCASVCGTSAIEKGHIDTGSCTMCLACVDACPQEALLVTMPGGDPERDSLGPKADRGPTGEARSAAIPRRQTALTVLLVIALVTLGAPGRSQEWPCFRGSPDGQAWRSLTSPSPYPLPRGEGRVRALPGWEWRPSSQVRGYVLGGSVWGSPSVARMRDDLVSFVGSYDHNVYAVGILDGRERWRFSTGGPVTATPAVAEVGGRWLVFVGAADRTLYGLNAATGQKVWARQVLDWRQTVGRGTVASPAVVYRQDGSTLALFAYWVYDSSLARPVERGALRACEAQSGKLVWEAGLGTSPPTSPVPGRVLGEQCVFVASADGNIRCLDAVDGAPRWRVTLQGSIAASPALTAGDDPLVLIGTRYGTMHALQASTGREVWRYRAGHWIDSSAAVGRVEGTEVALFGSHDQALHAVEAGTGRRLWVFETKADVYSSPAILQVAGRMVLAFASGDDVLYLVDAATGREVWRTSPGRYLWGYRVIGDGIWASPTAVEINGTVLVLLPFYDGVFHCYRADRAAVAKAVADPGYGDAMLKRALLTAIGSGLLAAFLVRADRRRHERQS